MIVHQLHLGGAALALILFDAKSETTPLAGVQHWARAVRHAHQVTADELPTFLVAARADRGGINVSDQRIHKLMADFGLTDYFKTSAKEGTNTDLLRARMLAAIDNLPDDEREVFGPGERVRLRRAPAAPEQRGLGRRPQCLGRRAAGGLDYHRSIDHRGGAFLR